MNNKNSREFYNKYDTEYLEKLFVNRVGLSDDTLQIIDILIKERKKNDIINRSDNKSEIPSFSYIANFLLSIFLGLISGILCANYMPLFGGIAAYAMPFSPVRLMVIPQHVFIFTIIIYICLYIKFQTKLKSLSNENYVKCSYCAELINKEAILCRYCGKDVK